MKIKNCFLLFEEYTRKLKDKARNEKIQEIGRKIRKQT
jgi:hypothetical protein